MDTVKPLNLQIYIISQYPIVPNDIIIVPLSNTIADWKSNKYAFQW